MSKFIYVEHKLNMLYSTYIILIINVYNWIHISDCKLSEKIFFKIQI